MEPITLQITLDFSHFHRYTGDGEAERVSVEELIIEEAATMLAHQAKADPMYPTLTDRVHRKLDELLDQHAAQMVTDAMTAAFQPVSRYGEPKGEPTTLREHLTKRIESWLTEQARDGGMSGRRTTHLQQLLGDVLTRQFEAEIKKAADKGRAEALALVQQRAAGVIADTIERMGKS